MNPKIIFAVAGGIAAAAIVLFVVMGQGGLGLPGLPSSQNVQTQPRDLVLSMNDVSPTRKDNMTADLQVAFNVYNPNRNTAILETIHYTIYIDKFKMTSGDIGSSPQGFVASQEGIFPIVSNTTLVVKDTRQAVRNELVAEVWDSMIAGQAEYRIEGTIVYKLTGTSFQFSAGEKEFVMLYP